MADIASVPAGPRGSYVEWAAVLAGAVVASALSFVLLTAGAAIGLSMLSPTGPPSATGWKATAAVFWILFVPILSLLIGGYVSGRMRAKAGDSLNADETEFRDGAHGLLVWSVSILIGGMLAYLSASVQPSRTPAMTVVPRAKAGVGEAPRHEIAGGGAPPAQRALWGFGCGARNDECGLQCPGPRSGGLGQSVACLRVARPGASRASSGRRGWPDALCGVSAVVAGR